MGEAFHAAVSDSEVQGYALVSGLQGYSPDLRFPSTSGVEHQESFPWKASSHAPPPAIRVVCLLLLVCDLFSFMRQ